MSELVLAQVFREGRIGHFTVHEVQVPGLALVSIMLAGLLKEAFGDLEPGLHDAPEQLERDGNLPPEIEHAIVAAEVQDDDSYHISVYAREPKIGEEVGQLLDRLLGVL